MPCPSAGGPSQPMSQLPGESGFMPEATKSLFSGERRHCSSFKQSLIFFFYHNTIMQPYGPNVQT